jgi:hypothetical protein
MLAVEEAKETYRSEYSVEETDVSSWPGIHSELRVGPWYVRIVDEVKEITEKDVSGITARRSNRAYRDF